MGDFLNHHIQDLQLKVAISLTFLQIMKKYRGNDRVIIPLLKVIAFLLKNGIFDALQPPQYNFSICSPLIE